MATPMKVLLATDNTLPLDLSGLCELLNSECDVTKYQASSVPLQIRESYVSRPDTYQGLPLRFRQKSDKSDLTVIGTTLPYDNNYFYQPEWPMAIVSFDKWNEYTKLPIANGFVYFLASLIGDYHHLGITHRKDKGCCLGDFLAVKSHVHQGLMKGYVCEECRDAIDMDDHENRSVLKDIEKLLALVSLASKSGNDLIRARRVRVRRTPQKSPVRKRAPKKDDIRTPDGDVFVSYNSLDCDAVMGICNGLRGFGVNPWLDRHQIRGGAGLKDRISNGMANAKAMVVVFGPNGVGPGQAEEITTVHNQKAAGQIRVIPVLLPGVDRVPDERFDGILYAQFKKSIDEIEGYQVLLSGIYS